MTDKRLRSLAFMLVILASLNTALALLASWQRLGGIEFFGFIKLVLDQYSVWARFFFWWVIPLILSVAEFLVPLPELDISLGDHAIDFFVFFWSYIIAFASVTYRLNGLWILSLFYITWGIIVALMLSAVVGVVDLKSHFRSLVLPFGFVMATAIFSVGTALRAAIFFPPSGYLPRQAFKHYSRHARRYFLFGTLVTALAYICLVYLFGVSDIWNESVTGLSVLTVVYTMLGAYRFILGPNQGNYHTQDGGWLESRLNSGEGLTGFSILSSAFVVAVGLVVSVLQSFV